jgi:hypothetical protein
MVADPTAIMAQAGEVPGLTVAMTESNVIAQRHGDAIDRLAKATEDLQEGVDRLRDGGDPLGCQVEIMY